MDPLFNEVGIYSATGQRYDPVDSELVLKYREAIDGQVLEEGITEAGSAAGFQAAGTSYSTHGFPVIPFYIFYSMFGFQRTGDQLWAAGDARARGFLMAATAGRTTLTGEGLQHDDGHSHVLAMTNPAVRQYDPAYAYELATIIRDGIDRMHVRGEDLIYYISIYNENYAQAAKPEGVDEAILRGLYRLADAPKVARKNGAKATPRVRLVGSGSILQQVLAAQALLADKFGIAAEIYSAPSWPELRRDALKADRWNRLHPDARSRSCRTSRAPRAGRWPDRRRVRLDEGPAGPPSAAGSMHRSSPSAPMGSGAATPARASAPTSRSTPPNIAAAALAALAKAGDITPRGGRKGHRRAGHRPRQGRPARHLNSAQGSLCRRLKAS